MGLGVIGLARRIAQGEVTEHKARNAAVLDNVFGRTHNHRWDAMSFQMSRGQTDRLMANGSVGHQYGQIDLIVLQHGQQVRTVLVLGGVLAAIGRQTVIAG